MSLALTLVGLSTMSASGAPTEPSPTQQTGAFRTKKEVPPRKTWRDTVPPIGSDRGPD